MLRWVPMKILIEDAESLKYFTGEGQWSKAASEGQCFTEANQAMQAAKQARIGKFNIVAFIPDNNQLVNLNHGRGKGA